MKLKAFCMFIAVLILTAAFPAVTASAYNITGFEIESQAVLFASLDTGSILYQKNVDERRYPASLTKLMTAAVVMDNCPDIDVEIEVPGYCIELLSGTGSTVGGLIAGEHISVRSLLEMLLVSSAADAANTLADYIGGGSIAQFVEMMNQKAEALEMQNTHFENPHGLHDDNHYSTASDLYKLALYVYEQPVLMDICSMSRVQIPATDQSDERLMVTTNLMQSAGSPCYYEYVRGMKTGYTSKAGRCLISTASRDGYNYICVLLGAEDQDNEADRIEFKDTENLYRWAFNTFEHRKVTNVNEPVAEVPLELNWDTDYLQLYPEKEVYAIVPQDVDDSSIIYDTVLSESTVSAPVEKGEIIGYARIVVAGEEVGSVNLVAGVDAQRSELLLIAKIFTTISGSIWFKLFIGALAVLLMLLIILNIIHNKKKRAQYKKVRKIRKI